MNTHSGTLLVVDDDRMQRMILSRCLSQQGHTVEAVENGAQALSRLMDRAFDAVLLDVKMPDMDGFEVLERIMSHQSLKQIPVIMVSGVEEMGGVVACIEMGAADYLYKPFDPSLLRARIQNCLENKRARDQEISLRAQLQDKYNQLSELEKLRDSLTSMIVHDLRTPLTSLLTGLQTVEMVGELNDDQQEIFQLSIDGGEQLLGMINDLLDVSKMEDGSMALDRQPIEISELVSGALRQVSPLAQEKRIALTTQLAPDLPPLALDENKLTRTMVNLLANALKFTPNGGAVAVTAKHENGECVLRVRDNGEGIPREAFDYVFEKFGQVETRKAGRKMSTGLGLTFCKLVVEAHEGRIWVESEIGQGSTFSFALPC